MTPTALVNGCLIAASRMGAIVWRNNVGLAVNPHSGQHIKYGLHKGASDIIGFLPIDGRAVFLAIECKTGTGRLSKDQVRFLNAVRANGGIALEVRTVAELETALTAATNQVKPED